MKTTYFHNATLDRHGVDVVTDSGECFGIACPDEKTARTLAAGPELLEALKGLLSSYAADFKTITSGELNETESVKKAKAAIQKATQP
jgi:hypothetical protein